jgi:hypothetical protein
MVWRRICPYLFPLELLRTLCNKVDSTKSNVYSLMQRIPAQIRPTLANIITDQEIIPFNQIVASAFANLLLAGAFSPS